MRDTSRRDLLAIGATALGVGVAGCSSFGSSLSSSSATNESTTDEAGTRIAELEAELEAKNEQLEAKNAEIERLKAKGDYQYSADVRERATAAGKQLREAVVLMEFGLEGGYGSGGTGWFIDDHHIVTNEHVVRDMIDGRTEEETGHLLDGTEFDFSVVAAADHQDADVALLETEQTAPYVPPRGSSSSLSPGQPLIQVGNPQGIGNWVIGLGEYKATEYDDIRTEMPSTQGNSGSPLATLDGTIVGLTYGGESGGSSSEKPAVADPVALEEYPYQTSTDALHEPIETVESNYEEWT